ncbi:hypothetical protein MSC49_36390 [Methylosinus sp. C49]|uniref:PepSY-associated TM helix domain-containing protein n=1 Tax=Methylosinus sp. C49 TaxID=2699395 RepID=UPI0013671FB2|nr:PepSY-associated TM helix domain-containing protein [Methylosinus sp. C49]BBU63704.1 hypothetical protein MSC49_36390 [Methylosinus sp. C49]
MTRTIFVFLHRWTGLALASFLILVGVTGSILVFLPELNHWLTPNLYPGRIDGAELSASALLRRAEELTPQARATRIFFAAPGTTIVSFEAKPGAAEVDALYLDPVSGDALGRVKQKGLPESLGDLLPFIDRLHWSLALGPWGVWLLGVVALVWTIDCFIAFYLTLPANLLRRRGFLARWKPAWLIKRGASFYRLNFDLHRASGLWLYPLLLVLAWSGVCFDLNVVYCGAMGLVFDFEPSIWKRDAPPMADRGEPMPFEEAERIARDLMEERAAREGFTIDRRVDFTLDRETGLYVYGVHSSRDVGEKYGGTTIAIDAYTGAVHGFHAPTGGKGGDTATEWLLELHMANVFGLPYRILVCAAGVAIALLSVTGVVIWRKKRGARRRSGERSGAVVARTEELPESM